MKTHFMPLFYLSILAVFPTWLSAQSPEESDSTAVKEIQIRFESGYYLALDKPGHIKRLRFYELEPFVFKRKDTQQWQSAEITAVGNGFFATFGQLHYLQDIKAVRTYTKNSMLFQTARTLIPLGGVLYILIDLLNSTRRSDLKPFAPEVLRTGGLMFVGGISLHLFKRKTHILGGNKRLKTLQGF